MASVSIWAMVSPWTPYLLALLALIIVHEQTLTLEEAFSSWSNSSGPHFGKVILVTNPTKFWELQSSFAKSTRHGVSANYVICRFILYISSPELSRKIFTNARPNAFQFIAHPFGNKPFLERIT
ncbi:hypothetical protein HAX54_023462 [Datura stramonium]|uniref:Uncharacterized protein n=1 Tax=Datura stramonium TaxID=4076 RepID=A0ABS8S762_DATST|nr:hypothetical protein [Datura stramonium]